MPLLPLCMGSHVMQHHALLWRRFDQLQAVDVEGVPPALRAGVEGANQLREDVPRVYENR